MRLMLDHGLPRSTVRHLADMGITSGHVADLGMATATDAQILDSARERQAVVVTLDSDFHALLATARAVGPSDVRIRIEGLTGEPLASILKRMLAVAQLLAAEVLPVQPPFGKEGSGEARLYAPQSGSCGTCRASVRLAVEFGPIFRAGEPVGMPPAWVF
jgi:predicted nuclease of predicted toxin-antitoxin system